MNNSIIAVQRANTTAAIENISGSNTLGGTVSLGTGGSQFAIQSDSGLLTLNNASAITTFAGGSARNVVLQGAGNGLVSGVISDGTATGGLIVTKSGGGTWTLSNTNTYTGATSITGGKLVVSGSLANTTVNVGTAGTLAGTGSVGGLVTLAGAGSTLDLRDASVGGFTLTNGATFNGGNILGFDVGTSVGSADLLSLTGGAYTGPSSGTAIVNLTALGGVNTGTYTLISGLGIVDTSGFSLNAPTLGGLNASLSANGGSLVLTLAASSAPANAYWKGDVDSTWSTNNAGNTNFDSDTVGTEAGVLPDGTSNVFFSASNNANPVATTLGGDQTVKTLNVLAGQTGAVSIGGANTLTIAGDTNTGAGITVQAGAGALTITTTAVAMGSSQTWTNDSANPITVSSIISGTGFGLTKAGTGSLILTGVNTYTGATTISGGTLQLGDGVTDGTIASTPSIVDNGILVYNRVGTFTNNNVISGTGSVIKTGAGTQILGGANTYAGGTTVNGGTLQLTNTAGSASTGTFNVDNSTLQINLGAGANFAYNPTLNFTGAAVLGNAAAGSATTTAGQINYTGTLNGDGTNALTINNTGLARLYMNGAVSNVPQVNVTGGAMGFDLSVGNRAGGAPVVVSNGAALWFANATNTLANNITLNGGSGIGSVGALSQEGAGAATLSGTITLTNGTNSSVGGNTAGATVAVNGNITGGGGLSKIGPNTFILAGNNDYSGGTTLAAGVLALNSATAIGSGNLTITGGSLNATTAGITLSTNNTQAWNGDFAFVGTNSLNLGTGAVTLGANRIVTVTANTLSTGAIGDGGNARTLSKAGTGVLLLTGNSTYTGATTITAGGLQLGDGVTDGSLSTANVVDTGVLAYNLAGNISSPYVISGTGVVAKLGAGMQTLSGANTYSGATTVTAGTLQAGVASVAGTSGAFGLNSAVSLANTAGATLGLNNFDTQIGSLSGGGANGGNVTMGTGNLTLGGANQTGSFAGIISGTGGLTKIGTGTETLTGTNSYSGSTTINGGTLAISADSALGAVPANPATNVTFNGNGTLAATATAALDVNRQILVNSGFTGTFNAGGAANVFTINGVVSNASNTGLLALTTSTTNASTGTVSLTNSNNFAAGTTINLGGGTNLGGGILRLANSNALGSNAITLNAAGGNSNWVSVVELAGGVTIGNNVTLNLSGHNQGGAGADNLRGASGNNVFNGAIRITGTGGSYQLDSADAAGTLTVASVENTLNSSRVLNLIGAGNGEITGSISETGGASSQVTLAKSGTGTWTLSSGNIGFTGATAISGGKLLVNGTHSNAGAYSVANGGTLGGTGTINASASNGVTIAAGGKLAPGISTGALTLNLGAAGAMDVSGAVTAVNSQALQFDLDTPETSGKVVVANANAATSLNFGSGVLELDDFAFTVTGNISVGQYTLFDSNALITGTLGANISGTFNGGITGNLQFGDSGNDLVLNITSVPEPTCLGFVGLGALGLTRRRRRAK